MKKRKKNNIILYIAFLAGLSLLLYPTLSNRWNQKHQSKAVAAYTDEIHKIDKMDYKRIREEAEAYNQSLVNKKNRFILDDDEKKEYKALLNLTSTGIMGYLEIPIIDVMIAVYHGTEQSVLQIAAGHVAGSSLPIGGESTHSIISGHSGLPSAKLFTDLEKLKEGDEFILHVMDEEMLYKVDQIRVVTPKELDEVRIEEGKDYCTLLTCTPYGINTHRLLVRGHREKTPEKVKERESIDSETVEHLPLMPLFVISVILLILLIVLSILLFKKNKAI